MTTVKPNRSGAAPIQNNMLVFSPGGRFSATNVTLVDVLVRVYPTRRIQMRGAPAWIDSDRYDLLAKAPDSATEPTRQQLREMVQMLLEDRFQLKMHQETRDEPVLAMVVDKNAPKLDPPKPGEEPLFHLGDQRKMIFDNVGMGGLVNTLSNIWQTPVVDHTGIKGSFDFTVDPYANGHAATSDFGELVRDAVERLGFRFQKEKAPMEITVIDHVERPSEN